jgi:hypothetical protein
MKDIKWRLQWNLIPTSFLQISIFKEKCKNVSALQYVRVLAAQQCKDYTVCWLRLYYKCNYLGLNFISILFHLIYLLPSTSRQNILYTIQKNTYSFHPGCKSSVKRYHTWLVYLVKSVSCNWGRTFPNLWHVSSIWNVTPMSLVALTATHKVSSLLHTADSSNCS